MSKPPPIITGEWPSCAIDKVFLDGEEQYRVFEVDLVAGRVTRGYMGEPKVNQTKVGPYVYDNLVNNDVLETVTGEVRIKWKNAEIARRWLAHYGVEYRDTH